MKVARTNHPAQPTVKRCAIYTRKSTSMGLEQSFNSLDAQREACEQYVRNRANEGWVLVPTRYDDGGYSGSNTDRPAFQRLLGDIEKGLVTCILCYKVDRVSRSLLDFAKIMDQFARAKVEFVSVTQNFSTTDAMGRLTLNMLMSFADFERSMIVERTRDKKIASKRKGKWTGGKLILGYDSIDKRLVINETEAAIVRDIFALYLREKSGLAVARILNDRKIARKKNGQNCHSLLWTKDSVVRLLRNPQYAGYVAYGEELHTGEHAAIIDVDTFERVRDLIEANDFPRAEPSRNPAYLLQGLLTCVPCGASFTPASTRKKGIEYRYYRCVTRDKQGRGACPSKPLPAYAIESMVVQRVKKAIREGQLSNSVFGRVQDKLADEKKRLAAEAKHIKEHMDQLNGEGQKLAVACQGPGAQFLESRIADVKEKLATLEVRQAELAHRQKGLEGKEIELSWVARTLGSFDELWESMSLLNRQRLVRALIKEVLVNEPVHKVNVVLWTDTGQESTCKIEVGT